jgi:glycosyltransferase involved in cell wall biosynthesis
MIPTFNPDERYLREALSAVLAQDPGPDAMEIVVIDDSSTSTVAKDVVERIGASRVAWFRHDAHVGIAANWNACIRRARGHWVHILHQDDLLFADFYQRLSQGIQASPSAGAAVCRDIVIDGHGRKKWSQPLLRETPGILSTWVDHVFLGLHLRASALVVKRSTYEALGGFREDLRYALDWDMWKRIVAACPLWYEPEILACYRRHGASATAGFVRSGQNIAEIRRSIDLSAVLLPEDISAAVTRRARENYTRYAVTHAWRALLQRDVPACYAQLREARKLSSTLTMVREIGRLVPRAHRIRR